MYPILTRHPLEWTKMDILHTTKYTFCPGILEAGKQGGRGGGAYARHKSPDFGPPLLLAPKIFGPNVQTCQPPFPPDYQTLQHPCCHVIPV
jgi:hypothetical protein